MAKILVDIEETLLVEALRHSQERKVSLDAFINDTLGASLKDARGGTTRQFMNVQDVINSAVERAQVKPIDSEFLLADLCSEEEWEGLSSGGRKSLGKGFRKAVESMTPPVAEYVRRTSANKAVYRRL